MLTTASPCSTSSRRFWGSARSVEIPEKEMAALPASIARRIAQAGVPSTLTATLAAKNPELVEHFLQETVAVAPAPGVNVEAQVALYAASFWGLFPQLEEALADGARVDVRRVSTELA